MVVRTDSSRPMTSGSEAEFLNAMIAHHREEIVAANQLARSPRPEMRALGRRIVLSRATQVRKLRHWLDRWYWPLPVIDHNRSTMSNLSQLHGDALDRAFLLEVIAHHTKAVRMSRHLLTSGIVRHARLGRLAASVVHDQTAEIALMEGLLRPSAPGPGSGPQMT